MDDYQPTFLQDSTSLHKKVKDVNFIRVRVTKVTGNFCHVYGVDSGSFHQCSHRKLVFLPASIIQHPPCGRLARLPGGMSFNERVLYALHFLKLIWFYCITVFQNLIFFSIS